MADAIAVIGAEPADHDHQMAHGPEGGWIMVSGALGLAAMCSDVLLAGARWLPSPRGRLLIRCGIALRRWGGDDEEGEVFACLCVDGHGQANAPGIDHASHGGSAQAEPGRE